MIRVVLDTNIIISAQFWGGVPGQIYAEAASKTFVVLTSEALITEITRVLGYPKFARAFATIGRNADVLVSDFRILAEIVAPVELPTDIVRDAKDVAVLACAVGDNAQYIVTGDDDLLTLKTYRNISIVSPAQFIEVLSTPRT